MGKHGGVTIRKIGSSTREYLLVSTGLLNWRTRSNHIVWSSMVPNVVVEWPIVAECRVRKWYCSHLIRRHVGRTGKEKCVVVNERAAVVARQQVEIYRSICWHDDLMTEE
jgi:hypothetical protein